MPTPKKSDVPTEIQLEHLERPVLAEHHRLIVHLVTFGYGKRVGLMRRGWIATSYAPARGIKIDYAMGAAIVLTDLGRKVTRTFSRNAAVQEMLGQQRLGGF
jgi:hypothetical protein